MSFVGKVAVVGVIGAALYWQFVIKKEDPNATLLKHNPIEDANKDYVKHKTGTQTEFSGKEATILQDPDGAKRAIGK